MNELTILYICVLTILATIFGTLKNIFVIKYSGSWKYIFTTLDQLFYIATVGIIVNDLKNITYVIFFIIGKNIGVFLADIIASTIVRKVYLITLYTTNHTDILEDYILQKGFSYNLVRGACKYRDSRDMFKIHISSKDKKRFFKDLRTILGKEPVCDIIEVTVTGKIKNRVEGK